MSDGLDFKADFSAGQSNAPKQLWRMMNGELVLADRPPHMYDEMFKNNGGPQPGKYFAYLSGVSDKFEEMTSYQGSEPQLREKVMLEFTIIKSQQWGGCSLVQYYTVPKNWGDERSLLRHAVSACLGHELQDGEGFSFKSFVRNPTELVIDTVQQRTQDGKRVYSKVKSVTAAHVQINADEGAAGIPTQQHQAVPQMPVQQAPSSSQLPAPMDVNHLVAAQQPAPAAAYNGPPVAVIPGVDDIPF